MPLPLLPQPSLQLWPWVVTWYQMDSAGIDLTTLTTPSFTPSAGELLVVKAVGADATITFGTPTGGGWTYTSRGSDTTGSHVSAAMWTAPVTTGGTPQTVSVTAAGTAQHHSVVVERWQDARVATSPALTDQRGTGAPSATNTTTVPGSTVTWLNGDWAAVDGAARAYRAGTIETGYRFVTGNYTAYWAYSGAVSPGAQTFGLTAPVGQTWTALAVELVPLQAQPDLVMAPMIGG